VPKPTDLIGEVRGPEGSDTSHFTDLKRWRPTRYSQTAASLAWRLARVVTFPGEFTARWASTRSQIRRATTRPAAAGAIKDRLAASLSDVVVEFVVDSESEVVQDRDRRSNHRTNHGADQSRLRERLEQLVEDAAGALGRQLLRFEVLGSAVAGDHRLPGRTEVADPVDLVGCGLDERPLTKVQEGDRKRPRAAAPSATNGQQDVGTSGDAGHDEAPYHRVEEADLATARE
jgi:hypothetical protein